MSRLLTCTRCGDEVDVTEAPVEFIDPALYVCGACMKAVPVDRQLSLVSRPPQSEHRPYDPRIAAIPY